MGLDISMNIVVGFEVNYTKQEMIEVWFDEKTGKPYDKKLTKLVCDLPDKKLEGLEEFVVDYAHPDEEHLAIAGIAIHSSPCHREVEDISEMIIEIDLNKCLSNILSMKEKFPDKTISLFCVPNFSY